MQRIRLRHPLGRPAGAAHCSWLPPQQLRDRRTGSRALGGGTWQATCCRDQGVLVLHIGTPEKTDQQGSLIAAMGRR
jgi:hypothetical protein